MSPRMYADMFIVIGKRMERRELIKTSLSVDVNKVGPCIIRVASHKTSSEQQPERPRLDIVGQKKRQPCTKSSAGYPRSNRTA